MSFPMFTPIRIIRQRLARHLKREALYSLRIVVFIGASDGVVAVDAVERGGVGECGWLVGVGGGGVGGVVLGGAFVEGFGHTARVFGDGCEGACDGSRGNGYGA